MSASTLDSPIVRLTVVLLLAAFIVAPFAGAADAPRPKPLTMATLLDRIQVEDLLTRYYYDLSRGKAHQLPEYFTADALLDVDGTLAKGREYSELRKVQGRWLISRRCIMSDSGTPDRFDTTYKPRETC